MSNISDVQPRPLKDLLTEIKQHETRLPIFQRDYVWAVSAVKKLLGSIGSGYPIGSILRLKTKYGKAPFEWKLFNSSANSPITIDSSFKYMILDGQQRLTSVLHAYYGVGEYLYFIDFKKLYSQYTDTPDDIDFEECIVESSKKSNVNKYNQEGFQKDNWLMPMTYLANGGYYQWLGKIQPIIPTEYNEIFDKCCDQLVNYPMPVVTLSDDMSIEAICTIFESLNSNGKQLTPFELVNARIYGQSESEIDLRKKVDDAKKQYQYIASREFSDYALLQIIALLVTYKTRLNYKNNHPEQDSKTNPVVSCKKKDVLNKITVGDINQYWDQVIDASDFTMNMLKSECGLINIKYLPYKSILVPLIATIVQIGLTQKKGPIVAATKSKLVKWYWNVVFAQIYETSTDTRGALDFIQLVDWIEHNKPQPSTLHSDSIAQLPLREFDNPNSGIYRGVICLINQNAKDFYTGNTVDTLDKLDDHHVFPYAFLRTNYPCTDLNAQQREQYYNCVLNRTLISSTTNQKIQAKSPSIYMSEIKEVHEDNLRSIIDNLSGNTHTKFHEILESHLLPYHDESSYINNDYELFLTQRQSIIEGEIKRVTGLQ
jgi:hypothetical protein